MGSKLIILANSDENEKIIGPSVSCSFSFRSTSVENIVNLFAISSRIKVVTCVEDIAVLLFFKNLQHCFRKNSKNILFVDQ